ncbi:MAG: hypothetical protein AB8G77_11580 [Rhodothermales bacterium]
MKRLRWWRKPGKHSNEANEGPYFEALRKQAPHDSFPAVQDWIQGIEPDANARIQHTTMQLSPMKSFLNTYKSRLALTSIIIAVTIVSCTTPVEHEETIGHVVSGVIESAHLSSSISQLNDLDWINPGQIKLGVVVFDERTGISHKNKNVVDSAAALSLDRRFVIPLPETGESQANSRAYDLNLIDGIRDVEVSQLLVTSKDPVYKVVLHSIWEKQDNIEFTPDQKLLKRAIEAHLETLELHGIQVKQAQDEQGNFVLSLIPPEGINKLGLVSLKKFMAEVALPPPPPANSQNNLSEEVLQTMIKKHAEIQEQISQMEAGRERDKLESYKKQLEAKLDSLQPKGEK